MSPNVFLLGPSIDSVTEALPLGLGGPAATPGYRQIKLGTPATSPGGLVHVALAPAEHPSDVAPVAVHAVFVQPVDSVPPAASRTPEFFMGHATAMKGTADPAAALPDGELTITVPGVVPSLDPYFVQTILEFPPAAVAAA